MRTTVGQVLVNSLLPDDMRDYSRVLDKKTTSNLMQTLATKYPDHYKNAVHELMMLGGVSAYTMGHTVTLDDVTPVSFDEKERKVIRGIIDDVNDDDSLTEREKADKLSDQLTKVVKAKEADTLERLRKSSNPLAQEVDSGARGNPTQLNSMVGSSVIAMDPKGRPAPVPILNSYAEGLTPGEYYAASFGTRTGAVSTKMATADSGFLGKQLALAAHKLLVSDDKPTPGIGLPVPADDPDNEGAVLAQDVGKHKAGTVITAAMVKSWPDDIKEILIRSPVSDIAADGGVPYESAGVREKGRFPDVGENIGIPAVHVISERLSQGALNVKHTGGAGGKRSGGFKVINQLMQVPEIYPSGAAHAASDGRVTSIVDAPQGGKYIEVDGHQHYVDVDQNPTVKVGDAVEAGDVLSDGLPNPAALVEHKGIGEGRRQFVNVMRDVMKNSGMDVNRRNLELMSRALINHVLITDETDAMPDAIPGDIVEYDRLANSYSPRDGSVTVPITSAKGGFLEKPVLHYSIGTRLTPSVVNNMKKYKVPSVTINSEPPPFKPFHERAMTNLLYSPDWLERLGSFFIGKGLLDAVHRGTSSNLSGRSYIPQLVTGTTIGKSKGLV